MVNEEETAEELDVTITDDLEMMETSWEEAEVAAEGEILWEKLCSPMHYKHVHVLRSEVYWHFSTMLHTVFIINRKIII